MLSKQAIKILREIESFGIDMGDHFRFTKGDLMELMKYIINKEFEN